MDTRNTQQPNGFALTGMILGISSIVLSLFLGFILGVLAIIFSVIGLKKTPRNGQAITGLVTGIVGTVISLIIGLIAAIAIAVSLSSVAIDGTSLSNANTLKEYAEETGQNTGTYPTFDQAKEKMAQSGITVEQQGSGMGGDLVYIPCYGEGAIIWYWSVKADDYVQIDVGRTDACEWN